MDNKFNEDLILLINKPYLWTSFDVVNKIKVFLKYYCHNPKIKVGHAGTLDPLATGLVIVCTGNYTKKVPEIQAMPKIYEGCFVIGASRPSYDKETEITEVKDYSYITEEMISKGVASLTGKILQQPPVFSAVKINGKRAYEYARKKSIDIEKTLKLREVEVYSFNVINIDLPRIYFRIKCSKGTYIRSIARDLGIFLNCGAYIDELRRTNIGNYDIVDAIEIESFKDLILNKSNN